MLKRVDKGIFYNTNNGRYHIKFTIRKGQQINCVAKIKLEDGTIRYAENKQEAKTAIMQYTLHGAPIDRVVLKRNTSYLSDCINKYISYCKTMDKKRVELIENYCNYFVIFLAGRDYRGDVSKARANITIGEITPNDFIEYMTYRKTCKIMTKTKAGEKWTGRYVSNASINRERNSIMGLFTYIYDTLNLLDTNPCKKWKALPIEDSTKQPLDTKQEQAILNLACEDIYFFTELVFLDTLGARKSEMYNLLWENTHLEGSRYFPNGYADLVNRKNGKTLRVPFSAELQTLLQNMPRMSEYVFTNPKTGTKYNNRYKKLNSILQKAGVKDLGIGYHIFRHNAASSLEQNGIEASVISELLGNTSGVVRTTYLNQGMKRKQEVIDLNSERIRKLVTRQEKEFFRHNLGITQVV